MSAIKILDSRAKIASADSGLPFPINFTSHLFHTPLLDFILKSTSLSNKVFFLNISEFIFSIGTPHNSHNFSIKGFSHFLPIELQAPPLIAIFLVARAFITIKLSDKDNSTDTPLYESFITTSRPEKASSSNSFIIKDKYSKFSLAKSNTTSFVAEPLIL